ncbi:MAG: multicopper oxidase domain-containing protein [Rhizomicrobium sp.]
MSSTWNRTIVVAASLLFALGATLAAPRKSPHAVPMAAATVPAASGQSSIRRSTRSRRYNPATPGAKPLALSSTQLLAPGEKRLDMHVVYTIGKLYNPSTNRFDHVTLRSYANSADGAAGEYVAPTIPVAPGDTIHIVLHNDLPDDPTCVDMPGMDMNHPHCFNGTNLHTHGLWVSPTGNSDNVLLSIDPKQTFEYIYNIPSDHPAGTFWYHTASPRLDRASGLQRHGRRDHHPGQPAADARQERRHRHLAPGHAGRSARHAADPICLPERGLHHPSQDSVGGSATVVAWTCDPDQTAIVGPYIGTDGKLGYSDKNAAATAEQLAPVGPLHQHQRHRAADLHRDRGPNRALAHDPCRRA